MNPRLLPILLLTALALLGVGCSENPSNTADQTQTPNMNDAFGGYLATDEQPAFGDPELAAEVADVAVYDDPALEDPEVSKCLTDTLSEYYHFRAVWGRLRFDPTVTELTDWTGAVTISRGTAIIRHTIHFELGQDYIGTRTERDSIGWVSYTSTHNDGIDVDFVVPYDSTATDPVTVTFATGLYSRTFTTDELMALDTVVQLADSNAVAFNGFRLHLRPCPRGFLAGHWGYDDDGNGVFRGIWLTRTGYVSGYLNGHFGVDADSNNVFFGKWITRDGQFEGLLRGAWGVNPGLGNALGLRKHARGWFDGGIFDANGSQIGVLKGRYHAHPAWRQGFFDGRWKLRCNDETVALDNDEGF